MTEVLHSFDLSLHTRQVILQRVDSFTNTEFGLYKSNHGVFAWAELTPRTFFSMILMATFSPVRMCLPSLTFAKPPAEGRNQKWCLETFPFLCTNTMTTTTRRKVTWANSFVNLIVSEELGGIVYRHALAFYLKGKSKRSLYAIRVIILLFSVLINNKLQRFVYTSSPQELNRSAGLLLKAMWM